MANREILKEWVDAFNSENIEAIMELYADTAALCLVAKYPVIGIGRNSIKKIYRWLFSSGRKTCLPKNIFEDGDNLILEWKDIEGFYACEVIQFSCNKIISQRSYQEKLPHLKFEQLSFQSN
ncbi:hypothetical protein GCM10007415_22500 [Parapedobacter pyrenivorans]|uniref:SnoaL-like domain-containing protein n=1 Tax=Parapedobacter pyrenivorans TaxID=1305674 RepID=A0A917M9N5_9SPHI|nr:nuclear transport factor 2 family protein [Parapedobacter pyrenivorans]GGG88064.1 hypothetical protein GCM10007415_22500 [Parapedobacter pyrenivorans]